jgi:hypothetical protein
MLWRYTRRDTKLLLLATLCVFSGYAYMLAEDWRMVREEHASLPVSAVGLYASVSETDESRIAQELREKERELLAREAVLQNAEKKRSDSLMLWYASGIGGILLALILLNFYLDYVRRRSLV